MIYNTSTSQQHPSLEPEVTQSDTQGKATVTD